MKNIVSMCVMATFLLPIGCGSSDTGGSAGTGGSGGAGGSTGSDSTSTSTGGGQGGEGGSRPDDPCYNAQLGSLGFVGDGTCQAWQVGVLCPWAFADTGTSEGGVVECIDGSWQAVECPIIFTNFTCPVQDVELGACDPAWDGLTCGWGTADAGFTCSGRAQCRDGQWVSLGVDQQSCIPEDAC